MTLLHDHGTYLPGSFDFDGFVARHSPRLRRMVARKTGDLHEAEEVLQEALLRAYEHRRRLVDDDGEPPGRRSRAAAGRRPAPRRPAQRRRGRGPESGRVDRDTADVVVASSEARVALDALSGCRPARQRCSGRARSRAWRYDEIGERMEMSEPAVGTVLSRGRQALRKEFARRGHALPAGGLVPLAPALLALQGGRELTRPVAPPASRPRCSARRPPSSWPPAS